MIRFFLFVFLLVSAAASAQTPVSGKWRYREIWIDSTLALLGDTTSTAPNKSIAIKDTTIYVKYNGVWKKAGGVSGGSFTGVTTDATLTGDGTSGNPLKIDTTVVATKNDVYTQPSYYGIVKERTVWADLSEYTAFGAVSASVSGGNISLGGGNNDFNRGLMWSTYGNTMLERWKYTIRVIPQTKTSTTYGIGFGIRGTSTWGSSAQSLNARIDLTDGSNSGLPYIYTGTALRSTGTSAISFSAGDTLLLTLERNGPDATFTAQNLTTGGAQVSVNYSFPTYVQPIPPNAAMFTLWAHGGTQIVDSINIFSRALKNADVMVLGDSKSVVYPDKYGNAYPSILRSAFNGVTNISGGSMRTPDFINTLSEIKALAPKQVLFQVFRNDIGSGLISFDSSKINVQRIYDSLTAWNITPYFIPFAENTVDLTEYNNWLRTTFPNNYINTWDIFRQNPGLLTDNVHFGTPGHKAVADAILNSGKLRLATSKNADAGPITTPTFSDTTGNAIFHMDGFPALTAQRYVASPSTFAGVARMNLKSGLTTIANGVGPGINFGVQKFGDIPRDFAALGAVRDGADNSGALVFWTTSAGSSAERMRLSRLGYLGIGNASPLSALHVSSANYPVGIFERVRPETNVPIGSLAVKGTSTGNMVDGFGVKMFFEIQDDAGTTNLIGSIGSIRAGADNSGHLVFETSTTGTVTERMRIWNNGSVFLGSAASSSNRRLYVDGSMGQNKDSLPIISAMAGHYINVLDTITGQYKRILPANLGLVTTAQLADSTAALRALAASLALYDARGKDSANSTNGTQFTLSTYTPIDGQAGLFEVRVTVIKDDQTAAGVFSQSIRFRKTGGAVTLGTPTAKHPDDLEVAINTADIDIDTNAGAIRVRATGIAATNLKWKVNYFVTTVTDL